MRILVISDINGRVERLESLLASVTGRRAEALFILGNIAQQNLNHQHADHITSPVTAAEASEQDVYRRIMDVLIQAGIPAYIIPGEHDAHLEHLRTILSSSPTGPRIRLVHRQVSMLDPRTVVAGFGGKLEATTPRDPHLLHFPDWEVRTAFEHLNSSDPLFQRAERRIFLFSTPPRGTIIDRDAEYHTGVEAINIVSRAYRPRLVCCAGPAEGRGVETLDGAVVVNPGSLARGSYASVTLHEDRVTAELRWLHTPVRFATLVVAIDGSEASWSALDLVPALTQRGATKVILVHAFEPLSETLGSPYYDAAISRNVEYGEHLLAQAAEILADLTPHRELLEGPAADAIVRTAIHHRADLILMGSRGLGRMRGLLGSVSQQVLRHAPCPVLVAPVGADMPPVIPDDEPLNKAASIDRG